jgi:putative addiction module component (TIGR02574 family)
MNDSLTTALLKLSPAERIQLAEDLWDSVAAEPENAPPLSEAQREEITRRLEAHARDATSSIGWDAVRARLWSRLS